MGQVTGVPTLTDDLYHYTSADVGVDSVLSQMHFRMGLIESTNDPRESRPHYPMVTGSSTPEGPDLDALWVEADQLLRRTAKVACFTLDYELPEDSFDSEALRGYAHPALWAHYGGRHRGVCLRFSKSRLSARINETKAELGRIFEGSVDYVLSPLDDFIAEGLDLAQIGEFGLDAVVARFMERNHRALFFRKHLDWSNEYEYRWVLVEPSLRPVYLDVSGCLTGLVLGDAFPTTRLGAVQDLARDCGNIEVTQVHFQRGRPRRVPLPVFSLRYRSSPKRPGSYEERLGELAAAEEARAVAEESAAERASLAVGDVYATIQEVASRARQLHEVEVTSYPLAHAIPLAERRTAAGVSEQSSVYDQGSMCVIEALPKQSLTLVLAIAVQVMPDGQMRVHAAIELERWLPTRNIRDELWRSPPTSGSVEMCRLAIHAILAETDRAFRAFDQMREGR